MKPQSPSEFICRITAQFDARSVMEGSMRSLQILPAILVVLPATIVLGAPSSFGKPPTECKTKPGSSSPLGLHWYYRINHATHQRCWYLSADGLRVRSSKLTRTTSAHLEAPPRYTVEETASASSQDNPPQLAPEQLTSGTNVASVVTIPVQTSTDFAGRWPDLPQALDLAHLEPTSLATSYVQEQAPDSRDQMPTMFKVDANSAGAEPAANSNAEQKHNDDSYFEQMFLSVSLGLGMLLLAGVSLKFARRLNQGTPGWLKPASFPSEDNFRWSARILNNDDRQTATHPGYDSELNRHGLSSVLKRADAGIHSPRSFAPSRPKMTERATERQVCMGDHAARPTAFGIQRFKSRSRLDEKLATA
jgi:hypothetical protein